VATSPLIHGRRIGPIQRFPFRQRCVLICIKAILFVRNSVFRLWRSFRYSNPVRFFSAKPPALQNISLPRRRNSDFVTILHKTARRRICGKPPFLSPPPSSIPSRAARTPRRAAAHPLPLPHRRHTPAARIAFSPPPLPFHLALSFFVMVHMAVVSTASWSVSATPTSTSIQTAVAPPGAYLPLPSPHHSYVLVRLNPVLLCYPRSAMGSFF
jgi:hypothetical protein